MILCPLYRPFEGEWVLEQRAAPAYLLLWASALSIWRAPAYVPTPSHLLHQVEKLWTWKTAWASHKSFNLNCFISKMGLQTFTTSISQSCVRVNEQTSMKVLWKMWYPVPHPSPCLDHVPGLGWTQISRSQQVYKLLRGNGRKSPVFNG